MGDDEEKEEDDTPVVDDEEDDAADAEEEDVDDEEEGDEEPKLIDVVHKWGKKRLQELLRSWREHPKGSRKVLLQRVYKVLNNRPDMTLQGAKDLAAAKEAKAIRAKEHAEAKAAKKALQG